MRYFLRSYGLPFTRVLLVESGSRNIFDVLVPRLYAANGYEIEVDLVTCHPGTPEGFRGRVYRVQEYTTTASRRRLARELSAHEYTVLGILCSNEDIMTKWKWMLVARLPVKVLIINENADFTWFDLLRWRHWSRMARIRLGLTGVSVSPTVFRVLMLPFSAVFLLCYAAVVHTKRRIRLNESRIH